MGSEHKKEEYYDIILTDVTLHMAKPRKPTSFYRQIEKTMHSHKPGRFFAKNVNIRDGKITLPFPMPPEIQTAKEKAEKEGKIVRFFMPKSGIPILIAPDVEEKIRADERKKQKSIAKKKRIHHTGTIL